MSAIPETSEEQKRWIAEQTQILAVEYATARVQENKNLNYEKELLEAEQMGYNNLYYWNERRIKENENNKGVFVWFIAFIVILLLSIPTCIMNGGRFPGSGGGGKYEEWRQN